MNNDTDYIVTFPGGRIGRYGSAQQAAVAMLTHDGYEYEIRRDGDQYRLWVSDQSRNTVGTLRMVETVAVGQTVEDVYEQVIRWQSWNNCHVYGAGEYFELADAAD